MKALPEPLGMLFDRGHVLVHSLDDGDKRKPPQRFADYMAKEFGVDPKRWLEAMKEPSRGYDIGRLNPLQRLSIIFFMYGERVPDFLISQVISAEWQGYADRSRLDRDIDVLDILQSSKGIPIGLCSNASPNEQGGDGILGLHKHISPDGYSHHLGALKPSPLAYQRAAKLLGVGTDMSRIWFVDDGADGSIEGAMSAGLTVIRYDSPGGHGATHPGVFDHLDIPVINQLRDLLMLLE